MNARTPTSFANATPIELSMFDMSRWKPITPERFAELFVEQFYAVEPGMPVASNFEELPDGRLRAVVYAPMRPLGADFERNRNTVEPHMVIIYDETSKKPTIMMRTDAMLDKEPAY